MVLLVVAAAVMAETLREKILMFICLYNILIQLKLTCYLMYSKNYFLSTKIFRLICRAIKFSIEKIDALPKIDSKNFDLVALPC